MQIKKHRAIIVASILATLIFFLSAFSISQSESFVFKEFDKLNIYDNFENISKFEVQSNTSKLLNYLSGKENNLDNTFFNEKEKLHSIDVKNIFQTLKILIFILFPIAIALVFIFYKKDMMELYKPYMLTFAIDGILIIILTILSLNFNTFFFQFHKVLFKNDLWLMNPKTDLMIRLFPEMFFKDALIRIFIFIVMISFVFFIFGLLLKQQVKFTKLTTKKK